MSTSNLISHRMFVSALAHEPEFCSMDEDGTADSSVLDSVVATRLEVLREGETARGWHETQTAFQFDYSS